MMLTELCGRLGTSVGLIKAPVNVAADEYFRWTSEILNDRAFKVSRKDIHGTVESLLVGLYPLTAPRITKSLFLPTINSEWAAFFNNHILGPDVAGSMSVLARRIGTQAMRVTSCPHTMPSRVTRESRGSWGANILEVYGEDGKIIRSISAANDGGRWRFDVSGAPFDFEDQQQYLAPRSRDRFNEEMLRKYLAQLAVDPLVDTAYDQNNGLGILILRNGGPANTVELQLADAGI